VLVPPFCVPTFFPTPTSSTAARRPLPYYDYDIICSKFGVKGYPTIKYFTDSTDPMGDKYEGGRDFESMKAWADENLGPSCGPKNLDLCSDDQKAEIEKYQAQDATELQVRQLRHYFGPVLAEISALLWSHARRMMCSRRALLFLIGACDQILLPIQAMVDAATKAAEDAESTFKTEVEKLQKNYEKLSKAKDDAVAAAATPELRIVKMVLAAGAKDAKDEL